jgi:hypothetical protein
LPLLFSLRLFRCLVTNRTIEGHSGWPRLLRR